MAETLVFKLYPQASYETPLQSMRWYQSLDGIAWDTTPVDEIVISTLPVSGINYTWDSLLADADKFHMLKSVDVSGAEAENGLTIPPLPKLLQAEMNGLSLSPKMNYSPGETVDFLFRLNDSAITKIGDQIKIDILDEYNSIVDTFYAQRIGSLYKASWNIPLNINQQLLAINHYGNDPDKFTLYDKWNLLGGSTIFQFNVNRHIEDPAEDNCIIHISLNGIVDEENVSAKDSAVLFTTRLNPFYSTVQDVRSVGFNYMHSYDDFTIIKKIINTSRQVDSHMRPDQIYYQEAFDLAVRNYVRVATALDLILPTSQTNQEEKRIDTFSYTVNSAQPSSILGPLQDMAKRYALFIWAGGKDTPFIAKTFEKGLFAPDRPELNRASFDSSGWFPYLNAKSSSYVTEIDGNNVEIRGERMVAYKYLSNRFSSNSFDTGDVGYLARI